MRSALMLDLGCGNVFARHTVLAEHFFNEHEEFGLSEDVFLPHARKSARPSLASPTIRDLPQLPIHPVATILFDESCHSLRSSPLPAPDGPSQHSQFVVGQGRKRRRTKLEEGVRMGKRVDGDEESSEDDCEIDLSRLRCDGAAKPTAHRSDALLRMRRQKKLSWANIEDLLGMPPPPSTSLEPRLKSPPPSFGFEALEKTYRELFDANASSDNRAIVSTSLPS